MLSTSAPSESLYRTGRSLLRLFLASSVHRSRILNPGLVPESGPVIVAFSQPPSPTDVLLLAAALPRVVRWVGTLKTDTHPMNVFLRLLSRILGLRRDKTRVDDHEAAFLRISTELRAGGLVALPVEIGPDAEANRSFSSRTVAEWIWRLVSQRNFRPEVKLLVLHLSHPNPGQRQKEAWLHFTPAVSARDLLLAPRDQSGPPPVQPLVAVMEQILAQNPFFLREDQIAVFLEDLETVVKTDMREEWSELPDWKQRPEDFDLSRFLVRWAHYARQHTPDRLLALSESLVRYRRHSQELALRRLKLETGSRWLAWGPLRWRLRRLQEQLREERKSLLAEIGQAREDFQNLQLSRPSDGSPSPPVSAPMTVDR